MKFLISALLILLFVPTNALADPQSFFDSHWTRPVPPQGVAPKEWSDIEASLHPEDCGSCHDSQYADWRHSRHAHAMGPGVVAQLGQPWLSKYSAESCLDCHAPLSEQRTWQPEDKTGWKKNPIHDPKLAATGVTCAACHLRKNRRYGPAPNKTPENDLPHGGFVTVDNFGDSQFCKPCHQFPQSGNRVSGKLLEDTYNQWRQSKYATQGLSCAACHMPDRKHLWRGIHDKKTVNSGVTIQTSRSDNRVTVQVINSGTGHFFPTYVTPQIAIRLYQTTDSGKKLLGEKWIGWKVALNLAEIYDTRIAPGEQFEARFTLTPNVKKSVLRVELEVYPDEFYHRFFEYMVNNRPEGIDLNAITKAAKETGASSYILHHEEIAPP